MNLKGKLNKKETLKFLNSFLANQDQPPMSNFVFNKFFAEFDVNKDGKISKLEMARFLKNFFDVSIGGEQAINSMVLLIFDQFDDNKNGFIERKEALELLNEILAITEKPKATFSQFKKFFSEIDLNNDGVL